MLAKLGAFIALSYYAFSPGYSQTLQEYSDEQEKAVEREGESYMRRDNLSIAKACMSQHETLKSYWYFAFGGGFCIVVALFYVAGRERKKKALLAEANRERMQGPTVAPIESSNVDARMNNFVSGQPSPQQPMQPMQPMH